MGPKGRPAVNSDYINIRNSEIRYKKSDPIGRGSFGCVYLGLYKGYEIAVKRIQKVDMQEIQNNELIREIEMQIKLKNDNVLQFIKSEEDDDFRYIALELCWGTLEDVIKNKKGTRPSIPSDVEVLYQIANGLHYIHSQKLVHRDIKPENILISKEGKIKISDFGFTKPTNSRGTFSISEVKGTLMWMAPELLKSTNNSIRGTIQSDVFSAGCVFFFFLTRGSHPYGEKNSIPSNIEKNQTVNIHKLNTADHFIGALDIIKEMIMHKPLNRPSFLKVMQRLPISPKGSNQAKPMAKQTLGHSQTTKVSGVSFRRVELSTDISSGIACIRFHPTQSMLACVKIVEGSIIFLNGNDFNSRSILPFSSQIEGVHIPTQALEWNVNGTQRAEFVENSPTMYKNDLLIWKYNYPNRNKIMYQGIPLAAQGLGKSVVVWNPFDPDSLATYKKMSNKELRILRSVNYREFFSHNIKTSWRIDGIEWIARNEIACCYYQNSESVTELSGGVVKVHQFDDQKLSSSKFITQYKHGDKKIEAIAWSKETKLLASCSIDGWIKVWSMEKRKFVTNFQVDIGCVSLVWFPNKKSIGNQNVTDSKHPFVVCGLCDGSILIWSPLESNNPPYKLKEHSSSSVNRLLLSPDNQFLASCSLKEIVIWSTATWKKLHILQGNFSEMTWDSKSCRLATLNQRSQMMVVEYQSTK